MSTGHLRLGRPSTTQLDRLLDRARSSPLTYEHVGSTLSPIDARRPVHQQHLVLGHGPESFEAARLGLQRWRCHGGIRAAVHPADAAIEDGSTLLVVLRAGPACIVVPDRVVAVVNEPGRFGFAYGTLEGHQEQGEESFVAELLDDGTVRGTITVDAVAATLPARLAAPLVTRFQRLAVSRYLSAWRSFVAAQPVE
jgi:uncharacterized protein (UPF0548 family)